MRWIAVVASVVVGAGCSGDSIAPIDAGIRIDAPPPDAAELPGFFGESCAADPFPAATVCHDGLGWCIDSVCRPMCTEDNPRCPRGVMHFALSGACYCAPT